MAKLQPAELIGDPRFRAPYEIERLAVIDQGKAILSIAAGQAYIWDMATGRELGRYAWPPLWLCALPDGKRLLGWCLEQDEHTRLYTNHRQTGKLLCAMELDVGGKGMSNPPIALDQERIVAGNEHGGITEFDMETGDKIRTWTAHEGAVTCLGLAADGKTLISAGADKTIGIWDPTTGILRHRLPAQADVTADLALAADGKRFASTSEMEKCVRLWDADVAQEVWNASLPDAGYQVAFSPDGQTLAVMCRDRKLHMIQATDGKERLVIDTKYPVTPAGGAALTRPFAFGADGKDVFIGVGGTVCRWNTWTGTRLFPPAEAGDTIALDGVSYLKMSASGRRLYAFGNRRAAQVLVWDTVQRHLVDVWQLVPELEYLDSLQLSPDGKSLLVGTPSSGAVVLDAETGQRRVSFPGDSEKKEARW